MPLSIPVRLPFPPRTDMAPIVLLATGIMAAFLTGAGKVQAAAAERKAGSDNRAAWNLLLDNKPLEARDAFLKTCEGKGGDAAVSGEACRGAGVVARFMGRHLDEVDLTLRAFAKDKDTLALMAG